MSMLDGGIAELFGEVFGEEYLSGFLHRATRTEKPGGGVDIAWENVAIKGQVDQISETMRAQAGYTAKDERLIILQKGPDGSQIPEIQTDDEITLNRLTGDVRWTVAATDRDPADSHYIVRGQKA